MGEQRVEGRSGEETGGWGYGGGIREGKWWVRGGVSDERG